MNAQARTIARTTTADAVVDARALVSLALVTLLGLVLILSPGAAWLHAT